LSILPTLFTTLICLGLCGSASTCAILLLLPIIPARWCGPLLAFTWGLLVISFGSAVLLIASVGIGLLVSGLR